MAKTRGPMVALCASIALINAAMAVGSSSATLVVGDELGTGWAAVPSTAGIVGTGLGSLVLSRGMSRWSRRTVLLGSHAAAALGACLALLSVAGADGSVLGLCAGMLLLGLGNSAAMLSRYVAAELYPAERSGRAIGLAVWAATLGAVGGPLLMEPAGSLARGLGWPELAGPFLLAAVVCLAATATGAGAPDGRSPGAAAGGAPAGGAGDADGTGSTGSTGGGAVSGGRVPLRELGRSPVARSALVVMATAQVVMVAVMTAAPLDLHRHGHGLGSVGMTLAAHTLGMFALSPLTGRLCDRLGARPVMLAGLLLLAASSGLAAVFAHGPALVQPVALFLLGYAWNLCFVGGSGRLARELPAGHRARMEGSVDAAVWGLAAAASLVSTPALALGGQGALAAAACLLACAAAFAAARSRVTPAAHPVPPARAAEPSGAPATARSGDEPGNESGGGAGDESGGGAGGGVGTRRRGRRS
ncbi:MFS transporter [Streptomyces sp. B6B3]|uniref:MFS transporter n=1 Tax=Streptomyces sp. B6B3 TaxID=3153570 RepID=UPI00325E35AC